MGKSSDSILITDNNLSRYGFLCFHRPGECELINESWMREAVIGTGGLQGDTIQKYKVPEEFCIELLDDEKIVDSDKYVISTSSDSQQTINLLLQRAGWNQTIADLESMVDHCKGEALIASYHFHNAKLPLGSGVSLPVNKEHGWIGMILVHPELRRQGIARTVMIACLEHARLIQNKSIIGLDATPLGKQVYDSLGFRDSFTIWRSVIVTTIGKALQDKNSMPFQIEKANEFLEKINYTERSGIIELFASLPDTKNFMYVNGKNIQGIILSRPGRLKPFIGPLIATSHEVAVVLLSIVLREWLDSGYKDVFMDIPEQHLENSIFIKEGSFPNSAVEGISVKPVRSFVRMYQLVTTKEMDERSDDLVMKKALDSYDQTATFMKKEIDEIVPKMYGTSGPEWS